MKILAGTEYRAKDKIVSKMTREGLTEENIRKIAVGMLNNLKARLAALDIDITFTDEAVAAVAKAGFDPVYGARPLRRAIQSKIEDELSELMLQGKVDSRHGVTCDYKDNAFVFDVK